MTLYEIYSKNMEKFVNTPVSGVYIPLKTLVDFLPEAPESWVKEIVKDQLKHRLDSSYMPFVGFGALAEYLGV